jgi:hypothetical protein
MKVVSLNKNKAEQRKKDLLEVVDNIRSQIEDGTIVELVAASIDKDNETQIHVSCVDFHGGVGLFEIGKQIFIHQLAIEIEE